MRSVAGTNAYSPPPKSCSNQRAAFMLHAAPAGSGGIFQAMPWRPFLALYRPRFRRSILLVVGVCALANYLWMSLISFFVLRLPFPDFNDFFLGAQALKQGLDPYHDFLIYNHYDFAHFYLYPPIVAWLVQPLLPLGLENASLLVLLLLQACVVAFFWFVYQALRPLSKDEIAFGVILSLSFGPIFANLGNDQVNVLVLLFSGVSLLAYCRADHWWGGAAYGLAMGIKPLQPAVGLLLVWGRRTRMVVAAAILGLIALLIPGPRLAFEFVFKVLPIISRGTGFRANASPSGLLERLFSPTSFFTGVASGNPWVRALDLAVIAAVVLVTWWRLGRQPRKTTLGRASEMAVAVAASPLVLTIANSWHLVLLLVPILVLIRIGLARADGWVLFSAILAFLLIGPAYDGMLRMLADNQGWFSSAGGGLALRVLNECQLAGMITLWLGCLRALGAGSSQEQSLKPSESPAMDSSHGTIASES